MPSRYGSNVPPPVPTRMTSGCSEVAPASAIRALMHASMLLQRRNALLVYENSLVDNVFVVEAVVRM